MGILDVLVVEDEDLIAMMIEDCLVEAGFTVVTARTGVEAIAYLEAREKPLAGLVTDIRLGDLNGWAVAKHAREKWAQIAIVYVTGDSALDWAANGVPGSLCVQKPFAAAQLVAAVVNQMNGAQPS